MKILVTGARGFLGKQLVKYLNLKGAEFILGVTRKRAEHENEIQCELTNYDEVVSMFERIRPDMIFHLAGTFSNRFEYDLRNNVVATQNLLNYLYENKLKTRVLVTGSAAEYGEVSREANPICENCLPLPMSIYGLTKYYQTELCKYYSRTKNIHVMVARIFNINGSGASDNLFIGNVEKQIADYKAGLIDRIRVGNIDACRDYLSVDEVCDALVKIIDHGESGEVYNVGSGRPIRIRKLFEDLLNEEGIKWSAVELITGYDNDKYDVPIVYADINKLKSLGGIKR